MSAALSTDTFDIHASASNVIAVDFGTAPVLTDYAAASAPRSANAVRLAAEAAELRSKVATNTDKKAGLARIVSKGRGESYTLNPYSIEIAEGWNCRDLRDPANLEWIDINARSIAAIGVLDPVTVLVQGDRLVLTDGHIRLLATFRAIEVYKADIRGIPAVLERKGGSAADHILRQILDGKAKSVLERGKVYMTLHHSFGWSVSELAEKTGKTTVRIQQVLDLMENINEEITTLIVTGKTSPTEVEQLLRDHGNDANKVEAALKAGLTVAVAAGKTKVTRKHLKVVDGKPTKADAKAAWAAKTVEVDGDLVAVKLTAAQLAILNAHFGE